MGEGHKHPWWTSRGAVWVVLDRAVELGWGATFRLALLLAVLLAGARLGADFVASATTQLAGWVSDLAH